MLPPSLCKFYVISGVSQNFASFVSCNLYPLVICGHFNVDMFAQTADQTGLSTLCESNEFFNIIELPTRVTLHSSALIDLIVINIKQPSTYFCVLLSDISHQFPIFISVVKTNYKHNNQTTQSYREHL